MVAKRGRPKLSGDALAFRQEVARQLRTAMTANNLTVTAAAVALGVSRQAFHQYLGATATPHPETIARAMDIWGIEPTYKGEKISRGALGTRVAPTSTPTQLDMLGLLDVPQKFENSNVLVTLKSSQNSTLQVTIKMKKAGGAGTRDLQQASKVG
jgi:hypothetical protein